MRQWKVGGGSWISGVIAVALAACGVPRPPSRVIQFEEVSHSAQLPNGLRVLVVEDHATNLVQLGIRVAVGSSSDPAGKAGLAHLVEHLMFQVGSRIDKQAVGAELSAVAIAFNAHTTWDATQYVTVARIDQLARLIELEARRFTARCEEISPGTFEREREVVRNERRLHRGLIGEDVERLAALIYPSGHPYTRSVGGSDLEISKLTQADACAFVAAHYQPERMVVVLTGDVRARSAIGLLGRHLGKIQGSRPARPPAKLAEPRFPELKAARRSTREHFIFGTGAKVVVAWPMPPAYGRDQAALSVAISLLQNELGREDGPGGVVMELGDTLAPVAVAMIPLGSGAKPGEVTVAKALAGLERASRRAKVERSPRALEPLINRRARELLADFDNLSSRVERLTEAFQIGGRDRVFVQELDSLLGLDPAEVSRVARTLFDPARAVVVEIEPDETADGEPQRSAVSYAGKSHDDAWTPPVDPREAEHTLRLPLPRSILQQAQRLRLENGLEVILLRTPGVPLLSARLVFAGGSADDPPGREGLAFLAAHALDFRQVRRVAPRYVAAYRALAWVGGDLGISVEADRTIFSISGLSSHMDVVLAGLASLVEDGQYSRDLLNRFRRAGAETDPELRSPTGAERWLERHAQLRRSLYRSVFGTSHPYARAANRLLRGGARVSLSDLERLRQVRFGARNGVLIVTGQFDPELVRDHVEHLFTELKPGATHVPARPPPAARTSRVVVAVPSDPADTTALIEIAYPTRKEPGRRAARMVLSHILRERMARVREVLGAAYSVSARHEDNVGPGMFLISATVDARRIDEALVTMVGELERLRTGDAPELAEAFVRARREVLYRLLAEESGANSAGARIASLVERGGSLDAQARLARQVMGLTVDDLQPVLASDLAAEHEYIGLLGPEKSIAAARRAAGL